MGLIDKFLDRTRGYFDGEEAPLRWLYPLFETMESFFVLLPRRSAQAPVVRDAIELKRYMTAVILSLLPLYAFGLVVFGPRLILMTVVSYAAGLAVEFLFAIIRKEEINEGFFVTGLIFPMVLPPATPLWIVAIGVMFGVFFGKEVFGGTGHNIFNPALVSRCFITLSWPGLLSKTYTKPFAWLDTFRGAETTLFATPVDALTTATPLSHVGDVVRSADPAVSLGGSDVLRYYFGLCSGSVCETCAVLILITGVWLAWTKVSNWRTPASILLAYFVPGMFLAWIWPQVFASPVIGLGVGGLLFGAFYMATDPVTSPATNEGKWIYGIGIGLVVLLIRGLGAAPEGVTYAILVMNIFAPLIDRQIIRASVPAPLPRKDGIHER